MRIIKQKIKGVYLIKPEPFKDKRGIFRRHFCTKELKIYGIINSVEQANVSENPKRGTLRGFHFQKKPHEEAKTISCFKGSFFDVIIDLRKKSPTYKKWQSFIINEKNRYSLHIPKGCANAFLTLIDNTVIHYYCSNPYKPKFESGILYNDPAFKIKWPFKPKHISVKDKGHKLYKI
tara:strand:+ start:157 stop:687 length:531 start_codon:yes stop_codon:yes gene_type:complete